MRSPACAPGSQSPRLVLYVGALLCLLGHVVAAAQADPGGVTLRTVKLPHLAASLLHRGFLNPASSSDADGTRGRGLAANAGPGPRTVGSAAALDGVATSSLDDQSVLRNTPKGHADVVGVAVSASDFPGLDLVKDGGRSLAEDGSLHIQALFVSPGSAWVTLLIGDISLPDGVQLYITAPDEQGGVPSPCTPAASCQSVTSSTLRGASTLSSIPIAGEEVFVQLVIPGNDPALLAKTRVWVESVIQGFKGLEKDDPVATPPGLEPPPTPPLPVIKNFQKPWFAGKSGPCNVDVRCTLGMPEDDLRHGIVEILAATPSAGAVKCSGSLLDNVGQRQLVLTASHCRQGANDDGRYYSFLFNYEYPCLASDYHGYSDYVDGGNIVYWDEVVDMMVVEITKPIPMNYRAFFLGWDVSGQVPGPVLTMHHPRGDVKKISHDYNAPGHSCPSCESGLSPADATSVNVRWIVEAWSTGTTEPGSSGAPLFDQNTGLVVGALSGGTAECPAGDGYDAFGKLSKAWERGLSQVLMGPTPQPIINAQAASVTAQVASASNFTDASGQPILKMGGTWAPDNGVWTSSTSPRRVSAAALAVALALFATVTVM